VGRPGSHTRQGPGSDGSVTRVAQQLVGYQSASLHRLATVPTPRSMSELEDLVALSVAVGQHYAVALDAHAIQLRKLLRASSPHPGSGAAPLTAARAATNPLRQCADYARTGADLLRQSYPRAVYDAYGPFTPASPAGGFDFES
jgi:hypothetical protein